MPTRGRIEELFRARRKQEAADAVPDEFVDEQALVGNAKRIRERYRAWADSGFTGPHIGTSQAAAIELMAEIALTAEPVGPVGPARSMRRGRWPRMRRKWSSRRQATRRS